MLLTRRIFRKLIFEALLLEMTITDIFTKYPLLQREGYAKFVKGITERKYLVFLDKVLQQYLEKIGLETSSTTSIEKLSDASGVLQFGEVVFMVLMHRKYANTDYISNEHRDLNSLDYYKRPGWRETKVGLVQLIEQSHFKHMAKNKKAYTSLSKEDQKVNEEAMVLRQANQAPSSENMSDMSDGFTNIEISDDLYIIGHVDGWDILRPESSIGSQAIGIENWCTVYSDAWDIYRSSGTTLYYVAKRNDMTTYIADKSYTDYECEEEPVASSYMSIGVDSNGNIIPGASGGETIFADQTGINARTLSEKGVPLETFQKITDMVTQHYAANEPPPLPVSDDDEWSEEEQLTPEQQAALIAQREKERQENKLKRAIAKSPAVFKEQLRAYGAPDHRMLFVLSTLTSPHLSLQVFDKIISILIGETDSKVNQSVLMGENKELFKLIIISLIDTNDVHLNIEGQRVLELRDYFMKSEIFINAISNGDYNLSFLKNSSIFSQFRNALGENVAESPMGKSFLSSINNYIDRYGINRRGEDFKPASATALFGSNISFSDNKNIVTLTREIADKIESEFDASNITGSKDEENVLTLFNSLDDESLCSQFEQKFLSQKYSDLIVELANFLIEEGTNSELLRNNENSSSRGWIIGNYLSPDQTANSLANSGFDYKKIFSLFMLQVFLRCPLVKEKLSDELSKKVLSDASTDSFVNDASQSSNRYRPKVTDVYQNVLSVIERYSGQTIPNNILTDLEVLKRLDIILSNNQYMSLATFSRGLELETIDKAIGAQLIQYASSLTNIMSFIEESFDPDSGIARHYRRSESVQRSHMRGQGAIYRQFFSWPHGGTITPFLNALNRIFNVYNIKRQTYIAKNSLREKQYTYWQEIFLPEIYRALRSNYPIKLAGGDFSRMKTDVGIVDSDSRGYLGLSTYIQHLGKGSFRY